MEHGDFQITEKDGWVYASHVPIFDEHTNTDINVTFDRARLEKIAANCNARITDTGDEVPLVIGHVPDESPEQDKVIVGWASNFVVGTWGKDDPRPCVFADFKFPSDRWETARQYPRRSVELWNPDSDDAYIDPIALLSGSTPRRDLGLLYTKKKSKDTPTYRYSIRGGQLDKDEIAKCFAELLENSDIGKYVRNQMKAAEGEADEPKAEDTPADEKPADEPAEKETDAEDEDDKTENSQEKAAQYARRYARLEADHKLLASRLAEMERRERVATRKADLLAVEAEGVLFDMGEELEAVADLEPAKYSKHLDKMRKRYGRSPIGVKVPVAAMPDHGAGVATGITPEKVQYAAQLVLSGKAKNTEEALKLVGGN